MKIGNHVDFNVDVWGSYTWGQFQKAYKPFESVTGVDAREAAKMLGIKVPAEKDPAKKK
jgi:hypothetical protein